MRTVGSGEFTNVKAHASPDFRDFTFFVGGGRKRGSGSATETRESRKIRIAAKRSADETHLRGATHAQSDRRLGHLVSWATVLHEHGTCIEQWR
jgi:hypothetical protein